MLDLASRTIQLTGGSADAYQARASLYAAMNEDAKAREDWAAAIAGGKRRLAELDGKPGPDRSAVLEKLSSVQALLGHSLLRHRRYADAEPHLRECLATREERLPDHWSRFNAMSLLGGALLGQGKFAAAEPLLVQGYEGMKQREATIPPRNPRLREAVERLVELYEATNRPETAAEWRKKLPLPIAPPPRVKRSP
jgi:tetratricopeptide (TPR) repeat protein